MIFSTARIKFFSDCIFGIAATVTVFNFFEASLTADIDHINQWEQFGKFLPTLLVYAISFPSLGIFWVGHHNFFHFTPRADMRLLWYNLHILFWITIMPFATSLLGHYPTMPVAAIFYSVVMTMVSLAFDIPRHYVVKHQLVIESGAQPMNIALKGINRIWQRRALIATICYFLAIPLSFLYLPATYFCIIAATILYLIPARIKNRQVAKIAYRKMLEEGD